MKTWLRSLVFIGISVPVAMYLVTTPARDVFDKGSFPYEHFYAVTWFAMFLVYRLAIILFWYKDRYKEPAIRIVREVQMLDEAKMRYEDALISDYNGLDEKFYHNNTRTFSEAGFSLLGDFRDSCGLEKFPDAKAVFRVMINEDKRAFALLLHFLKMEKDPKTLDSPPAIKASVRSMSLFSRKSTGEFIVTALTEAPASPNFAPGIIMTRLPFENDPFGLIAAHEKAVYGVKSETVAMRNITDYLGMVGDMQKTAHEYRKEQGVEWYREYFALMNKEKDGVKLMRHIEAEVARLAKLKVSKGGKKRH